MSFNDFPVSQQLLDGIYCMGFNTPTEFQKKASDKLLSDQRYNMIAQSRAGSGRTVSSVLAMLHRVDVTRHYPQAVCLSPTPNLALNRGEVAESMGQFMRNLRIGYAVGGIRAVPRGEKVTYHIIFGTPGTLLDWIRKHKVLDPKKIELCVLDQADVMIALQGHQDQSIRIQKTLRKDCQMLFITETYNDMVKEFAKSVVPNVEMTEPYHEEEWLGNIEHYYVGCQSREEKLQALSNIYGVVPIGQCVVFCQTTSAASWLSQKMRQDGHSVALIVDETAEDERFRTQRNLFSGSERLLITTVDFDLETPEMTIVINYDMPVDPIGESDCETYRRRAHHTGWLNRGGIVLNFTDIQPSMETTRKIGKTFGINMTHLDTDDVDTLNNLQNLHI